MHASSVYANPENRKIYSSLATSPQTKDGTVPKPLCISWFYWTVDPGYFPRLWPHLCKQTLLQLPTGVSCLLTWRVTSGPSHCLSGDESAHQAGDSGAVPGPGRSHMPRGNKPVCHHYWACALEPRSQNHQGHRLQLQKPGRPGACAPQQERPWRWEAQASSLERGPRSLHPERARCSNKDPAQPKLSKFKRNFLNGWLVHWDIWKPHNLGGLHTLWKPDAWCFLGDDKAKRLCRGSDVRGHL